MGTVCRLAMGELEAGVAWVSTDLASCVDSLVWSVDRLAARDQPVMATYENDVSRAEDPEDYRPREACRGPQLSRLPGECRMSHRVVITGAGCITPLGSEIDGVWHSLKEGRSGIGPISIFDARGFPVRIAAEVRDWDLSEVGQDPADWKGHPRQTHFAVGAAISGITLVCGENVCGVDPELELDARGKMTTSDIQTLRRNESWNDNN